MVEDPEVVAARKAGEQAARDQAAREQAAKDQAARNQAVRDQAAKDQAARDQAAKDQAARDQATRDQATREQAARDQAAKPAAPEPMDVPRVVAPAPAPVRTTQPPKPTAADTEGSSSQRFSSCAETQRQVSPWGRPAGSQGQPQGQGHQFQVDADLYAANTARDGDKDGIACER